MVLREIGNRLRFLRKKRTQKEFASQYGIPQGTVSKFESGKLEPGLAFLTEISKKEGVSINWILTGETDESKKWTLREPAVEYQALPIANRKLLHSVVEILESDNEAIIEILKANIEVCLDAIRTGKKKGRTR
ncbi:MAG: helix-turn-helix domain-containing protein [Thermodesulfobacteriota bacterium]